MRNLAISTLALTALLFVPSCAAEAKVDTDATIKTQMEQIAAAVGDVKDEASAKDANTKITDLVGEVASTLGKAKTMAGTDMQKINATVAAEKKTITDKINALAADLKQHLQPSLDALARLN